MLPPQTVTFVVLHGTKIHVCNNDGHDSDDEDDSDNPWIEPPPEDNTPPGTDGDSSGDDTNKGNGDDTEDKPSKTTSGSESNSNMDLSPAALGALLASVAIVVVLIACFACRCYKYICCCCSGNGDNQVVRRPKKQVHTQLGQDDLDDADGLILDENYSPPDFSAPRCPRNSSDPAYWPSSHVSGRRPKGL